MEDNDINILLERKASQPMMPFLRTSRDVDYFVEEYDGNSEMKQRYTSNRKIIKETSIESVKTTTQGTYNLRGNTVRRRSEPPEESDQKRTRHGRSRRQMVSNGASTLVNEESRSHHKRSASSRSANTSDYSSDEGRYLKGTAYPLYKEAGDWWDVFPKTDYTYSPVSPNRREIAPGIIPMPNMSRYSLRSDSTINYSRRHSPDSSSMNESWFGSNFSGTRARRRRDYADDNSDVDYDVEYSERSSVFSKIFTVFTSIWSFVSHITRSLAQTTHSVFRREGSVTRTSLDSADFGSDTEDVDLVYADRSSHKSTFFLTRIVSSVFTYIYETGRSLFVSDSRQVPAHLVDSSQRGGWHHYWTVCKTRVMDSWLVSLFSSSRVDSQVDGRPSRRKYLLLFLLPLLLLAGWWFFPSSTFENSVWTTLDEASSKIRSWWWLPIPLFGSRASEKKIILPGQDHSVNLDLLVQKIVINEEFQNLVLSEALKRDEQQGHILTNLQLQKETLEQQLNQKNEQLDELHARLAGEVQLMKQHMEDLELKLQAVRDPSQVWRGTVRRLEDRIKLLELSLNTRPCCKVPPAILPSVAIEEHVMKFLSGLFASDGEAESKIPGMRTWVEKLFVAKEDLEAKLANITSNMNSEVNEASRRSAQVIMTMVSDRIKNEYVKQQAELRAKLHEENRQWMGPITSMSDNCTLTVSQVQDIVNNALNTYDADKTGMVDYALESSGGSIINTRCTDTYNARTATLSFLGVPYWWLSSNPRKVIQPGVSPGECWAFRGAQGYLVIRLSGPVKISAFSLEHIPVSLAPNGRIDSAPKDFSVWGLKNENDKDPELLGQYMYRDNGTSLQIFSVQRTNLPAFEIVELRIESNHGNLEYTCLYRFRVHGVLSEE